MVGSCWRYVVLCFRHRYGYRSYRRRSMSGYTVLGGNLQTKYTKLTTTSATTVLDGGQSGATAVAIYACEISGNTPTLSIDRFDGTTATFVRPVKALASKEEVTKEVLLVLKAGELLRATAS